jgi:hypothetical protein
MNPLERTTTDVLEDHLRLRGDGRLEEDLARNYSPDVVVFSSEGRFQGHDGIRRTAHVLYQYVERGRYE